MPQSPTTSGSGDAKNPPAIEPAATGEHPTYIPVLRCPAPREFELAAEVVGHPEQEGLALGVGFRIREASETPDCPPRGKRENHAGPG